jgi:hypothetical protein
VGTEQEAVITDLFWTIATSDVVIYALGLVALAALIVTHVPLIRWIPTIDDYLRLAAAVGYLALFLFGLFLGARIADERAENQRLKGELQWSDNQLEQQKATAEEKARLLDEAEARATEANNKVQSYVDTLSKLPADDCVITADDRRRLLDIAR